MASRTSFIKFRTLIRTYASQASRDKVRQRLESKKAIFQVDNDLPVHLKGGFVDKMVFMTTAGLVSIGAATGFYTAARMVLKK